MAYGLVGDLHAEKVLGVALRGDWLCKKVTYWASSARAGGQSKVQHQRGDSIPGLHGGAADQQHPIRLACLHSPFAGSVQGHGGQHLVQLPYPQD